MIPVVWATQVYPRFEGDAMGGFLHRLARELPARGFAPTVVVPGADGVPNEETWDGVQIVRFRYAPDGKQNLAYTGVMHTLALRYPVRFASFLRGFRRAVREEVAGLRPPIVHAHWWIPSGWAAVPAVDRASFVLSLHGTDVRLLRRFAFLRPVARRVFRRADRVLPVSHALERALDDLRMGGGPRTLLPMPPDDEVFAAGADEQRRPAEFVVAARLTAQKRVDLALRALAALGRGGTEAVLHVAGDGPERKRLEHLAAELGLGENVVFHGMLRPERLAELFGTATAVVLSSEEEGYGLTIVEGALCGAPSIGTRSGGIGELIDPDATGRLVEPGDVEGLAGAMGELATDPGLARRLGEAARQAAEARTPAPLADRLAAVYGELSAARGRP